MVKPSLFIPHFARSSPKTEIDISQVLIIFIVKILVTMD